MVPVLEPCPEVHLPRERPSRALVAPEKERLLRRLEELRRLITSKVDRTTLLKRLGQIEPAPLLDNARLAAMSGRISVGCKSPLTGGIKEANSGGQPSKVLARMGYAAIVLEGRAAFLLTDAGRVPLAPQTLP